MKRKPKLALLPLLFVVLLTCSIHPQAPTTSASPTQNTPTGTVDSPMHVGHGVTEPRIIHDVQPIYTPTDEEKKHWSDCQAYLVIDEQGLPQKIRIVHCPSPQYSEKIMEAVKQYRFKSAMYQGHPVVVDMYIDVSVDFF